MTSLANVTRNTEAILITNNNVIFDVIFYDSSRPQVLDEVWHVADSTHLSKRVDKSQVSFSGAIEFSYKSQREKKEA